LTKSEFGKFTSMEKQLLIELIWKSKYFEKPS
jgi:hypothetical protein